MTQIVIDATMVLPWLFDDLASRASDVLFDRIAVSGALVPACWHLDLADQLLIAERHRRITPAGTAKRLKLLAALPIEVDGEMVSRAWRELTAMARADDLLTREAAYLELARRYQLPLASLNRNLLCAAIRRGIKIYH